MKKTLLYSLAAMASLALASCAGDYDDWANPQANEQEASAAKYGVTFANGSEAEGSMADEDGIINLVTVNSSDANVSGFTLQDFKVNGVAVNGTMVGNNVQVSASELEKLVCDQNKSRASVARDLKVETQVSINLASGDAVSFTTKGETTGKFTPAATPQLDEKGYYMLGQVNGNEWDATAPVWMNQISDGVYQLRVQLQQTRTGLSSMQAATTLRVTGIPSTREPWAARRTVLKTHSDTFSMMAIHGVNFGLQLSQELVHGLLLLI